MTMTKMRAKMTIASVTDHGTIETLRFHAVSSKAGYGEDGLDEDNTFAKFTPSASIDMTIANPALLGKFKPGQTFYIDFTPVPEKQVVAGPQDYPGPVPRRVA